MAKTFAIGDIHGNYKGLMQALKKSGFDYEKDTLISLGDVVDGHCDSYEVVEELLKIKNLISVRGNHDDWFRIWIATGKNPASWGQGQAATGYSYMRKLGMEDTFNGLTTLLKPSDIPEAHRKFFKNQLPYYLDEQNRLFIHGGFNRHEALEHQDEFIFWWDRDLWSAALSYESMMKGVNGEDKPKFKMVGDFKEVFIGHTQTQFWGINTPMRAANIYNLDTGGGWHGFVTIMDIDTKEYWQSDDAKSLYPEFKGR